ncbi:MAG: hypothetical protein ACRD28_13350 [Acidobacteriaceae bacterium]
MARLQRLIEDAVSALTALDAYALEQIRLETQGLGSVALSSTDSAALLDSHRLLGALLQETERNLKLFRATSISAQQACDTGCYAYPTR